MLRLTATDQSITMTTSATGSVDYISDWTDIVNTTAVTTAGSGQGNVTTAATTTIIAAPASGSSRAVRSAMISNRHGSTSNTIQLFKTVGAASYAISKPLVLLAGETVRFSDEGFCFVGNACELEVTSATTAEQLESNATTGVMQIVGPAAGTTRIATIPDANFTMARTDAAQTFVGYNRFNNVVSPTCFYGYSAILGVATADKGCVRFGLNDNYYGLIDYEDSGSTTFTIKNTIADANGRINFVTNAASRLEIRAAYCLFRNRVLIDDTTDATTTTDGSIQTCGGLSVVKSAIIGADIKVVGKAGFNNTAPIVKPTVSGSRGGNAAIASLLTALASYGLITDSTTA